MSKTDEFLIRVLGDVKVGVYECASANVSQQSRDKTVLEGKVYIRLKSLLPGYVTVMMHQ